MLMLLYKFTLFPGLTFCTILLVPAILFFVCYTLAALVEQCCFLSRGFKRGERSQRRRRVRQHFSSKNCFLIFCSIFCALATGVFLDNWLSESIDESLLDKGSFIVIALWTFHVFIKMGIVQVTWNIQGRMTFFQQVNMAIDNICSVIVSVWCLTISVHELFNK